MIARRTARVLAFVTGGLLVAGPVLAQPSPAAAPKAAASKADVSKSGPDKRMENRVEQRIAALRSKLEITPEETPAFDEFAGVMRDNAAHMETLLQQRRATLASATAVDDMKSYQSMAQAHVDDLNRLVPAFAKLYDTLSPEQKKLADQSFHDFQGHRMDGARRG